MASTPKFRAQDYSVTKLNRRLAISFIAARHYTRSCPRTAYLFLGLRDSDGYLCGAAVVMPPVPGVATWAARELNCNKDEVCTLSRMVILDEVPRNAGSFLLSRALKFSAPRYRVCVTYADSSQGHTGQVYRASGWSFAGVAGSRFQWYDSDGRHKSPRATRNIPIWEMINRGWTRKRAGVKYRYIQGTSPKWRRLVRKWAGKASREWL